MGLRWSAQELKVAQKLRSPPNCEGERIHEANEIIHTSVEHKEEELVKKNRTHLPRRLLHYLPRYRNHVSPTQKRDEEVHSMILDEYTRPRTVLHRSPGKTEHVTKEKRYKCQQPRK